MSWDISFENEKGIFDLMTLAECEIKKSVDTLTDIATIILPETILNSPLDMEKEISRGTKVKIRLGYDDEMRDEFHGYIQNITVIDGSLKIICENDLYLFRREIKDTELKPVTMVKLLETITQQIDPAYTVQCDYDITYEKFVIYKATAYDILKKLKEETNANIYFDCVNKILHAHAPYVYKTGEVIYSLQQNVETASLEYKKAIDKKIEVVLETTDKYGQVTTTTVGTPGGDRKTIKTGNIINKDLNEIANSELIKHMYDGYEGTLDTWLIPYVEPSYTAKIIDEDYPDKESNYYVVSVTTQFSSSGGKRTVTPGIKVSVPNEKNLK